MVVHIEKGEITKDASSVLGVAQKGYFFDFDSNIVLCHGNPEMLFRIKKVFLSQEQVENLKKCLDSIV